MKALRSWCTIPHAFSFTAQMFVEAHVDVEVLLDKRQWRNGKRGIVSFLLSLHENSEHKV